MLYSRASAQSSGIDLIAKELEITQGTQDLKNSVRLVADKRTYVRFHVQSAADGATTSAVLRVTAGDKNVTLRPINPQGRIAITSSPDRLIRDNAFLFELPNGFRNGTISLEAEVNPSDAAVPRDAEESDYTNNITRISAAVFEVVSRLNVVVYNIGYQIDGVAHWVPDEHLVQMIEWVRKAWPVSEVHHIFRKELIGDKLPTCDHVNSFLASKRVWDLQNTTLPEGITPTTFYYGVTNESGGFMRGCAEGLGGWVSSGPTGVPKQDNDDFFGRWNPEISWGGFYFGHELAHTAGRPHIPFCDTTGAEPYPYPEGRLGPTLTGPDAIYGFDIQTQAIFGPNWKDNMSYCPLQWNSKFTYHALLDVLKDLKTASSSVIREPETPETKVQLQEPRSDRLLVVGTIHTDKNFAILEPAILIPNAREVKVHKDGPYAIVLRDSANRELQRYRFIPEKMDEEEDQHSHDAPPGEHQLEITELVPYVAGTTGIDVEGPNGSVLARIRAGVRPPTITITSPAGGEVFSGDITIKWIASDPDGDRLTFDVQYSPDNGATWEMVDQYVTEQTLTIDAIDIVAGKRCLFRVWATDGIHSATDTVDSPFEVPNHPPEIEILSPASGTTIIAGQTLALEAEVYDIDLGSISGDKLKWSSSLDGPLGSGEEVSVASLRAGIHKITLRVDDGDGGISTATVEVHVRAANAPPPRIIRIAQVVHGAGFETTITLKNPSSTETANGFIYLFGSNGKPEVEVVSQPVISFAIAPSGTYTYRTHAQRDLTVGYATIITYENVVVSVTYKAPGLGTTVTGESPAGVFGFRAVVERNRAKGLDAGVSVVNIGTSAMRVVFRLADLNGRTLKDVTSLVLSPGEQANKLFSDLFPGLDTFRGTLRVGITGSTVVPTRTLTGTVIQFGGGQFSAVPMFTFTKQELGTDPN